MVACEKPKEEIVLRQVKDVVADATSEPMLKAQAVFYNPNDIRMRLKKIKVDVIIDGKKRAEIDQSLNTVIPAKGEFTVPLEVKLAMKEMGFLTTVMSMISGKRMEIQYVGSLKISYHGVPIRVPVDYKSEIRIKI
ncbi:MAG: LEA type 2 family protein [Bacteroidia bacterium]|nr:LEA type 2 family protein [Bacteroidia bacterium]